ncbi:hypothetical protein [Bdellovibrio sp. NC01]|uniref:hypothetical protein n=1 Tax=Bdellovibrio sp. NC01 TaxID=2220073 RepID=UPI0011595FE7|nr:hypothetical protein [Bdellovibrio sp. NC01]QDK38854.1 hypothetical protein DOE51_15300 [Bdellovibrio sp. NC01]
MPKIPAGIVNPKSKGKSQPRLRPSIHKDRINPQDYMKYDTRFSCEDCSHFDSDKVVCTIGLVPEHHTKAAQTHQYELAGNMAFCRFIEID